jgi:arylsulfatase A-like enzyme
MVSIGLLAAAAAARGEEPARRPPNVLFIVIDDLNDWVGYLGGHPASRTPNLDRLARRGLRFTHAYASAPLCNPSRTAVLSGRRPSSTGVYSNAVDSRTVIDPASMMTARFREAGYYVAGAGKIAHDERVSDWDEFYKASSKSRGPQAEADGEREKEGSTLLGSGPTDRDASEMADYRNTSWILERLDQPRDRPFFLALGLHKPHLEWDVPRRHYDQFPPDAIELPPYREDDLEDLPEAGVRMAKARKEADVERARAASRGPLESDHELIVGAGAWKRSLQGYLAAISFMDDNLGRVVDALERTPHRDHTIVVLWSDHGWHLGEKHHWRKSTLWEEATRAPVIWIVPGMTRPDTVCDRTVDHMSIQPTLLDLAGIPIPEHVEGTSIRPLLENPAAPWDRPAVTTHLQGNHAVRSERWRYIRYADGGEELYHETVDPSEWTNLAGKPELEAVKRDLARWLPTTDAPPVARSRSVESFDGRPRKP